MSVEGSYLLPTELEAVTLPGHCAMVTSSGHGALLTLHFEQQVVVFLWLCFLSKCPCTREVSAHSPLPVVPGVGLFYSTTPVESLQSYKKTQL